MSLIPRLTQTISGLLQLILLVDTDLEADDIVF